jgi:hypothetical protein
MPNSFSWIDSDRLSNNIVDVFSSNALAFHLFPDFDKELHVRRGRLLTSSSKAAATFTAATPSQAS